MTRSADVQTIIGAVKQVGAVDIVGAIGSGRTFVLDAVEAAFLGDVLVVRVPGRAAVADVKNKLDDAAAEAAKKSIDCSVFVDDCEYLSTEACVAVAEFCAKPRFRLVTSRATGQSRPRALGGRPATILLTPVASDELADIVRHDMDRDIDAHTARRLHERSAGNIAMALNLLRTGTVAGTVTDDGTTLSARDDLWNPLMMETVENVLRNLDDSQRETLAVVAEIAPATLGAVKRAVGSLEYLALVEQGILEMSPPGGPLPADLTPVHDGTVLCLTYPVLSDWCREDSGLLRLMRLSRIDQALTAEDDSLLPWQCSPRYLRELQTRLPGRIYELEQAWDTAESRPVHRADSEAELLVALEQGRITELLELTHDAEQAGTLTSYGERLRVLALVLDGQLDQASTYSSRLRGEAVATGDVLAISDWATAATTLNDIADAGYDIARGWVQNFSRALLSSTATPRDGLLTMVWPYWPQYLEVDFDTGVEAGDALSRLGDELWRQHRTLDAACAYVLAATVDPSPKRKPALEGRVTAVHARGIDMERRLRLAFIDADWGSVEKLAADFQKWYGSERALSIWQDLGGAYATAAEGAPTAEERARLKRAAAGTSVKQRAIQAVLAAVGQDDEDLYMQLNEAERKLAGLVIDRKARSKMRELLEMTEPTVRRRIHALCEKLGVLDEEHLAARYATVHAAHHQE